MTLPLHFPAVIALAGTSRVLLEICLSAILYTYLGYPALLFLVGSLFRRRNPDPGYYPSISILIAAYNEAGNIGRKLEQTLALDYPAGKVEIIVLSDCSTDATDEVVKSFRDRRVRLVRMKTRRGKTSAQNVGVKIARGEIIVFSDATTIYHPQALRYLAANYRDKRVGAVTGRNHYFDLEENSPTGLGSAAFWSYENIIKAMQSRILTLSGCVGCIYSVRKSLYTKLRDDIISDLVQPLWVIQKGYRVVFESRAWAYEQTTSSANHEFWMRVRVITRGMRGILSVPELLKPWKYGWISFQLFSHKIMRWIMPFFLIGALLCSMLANPASLWAESLLKLQLTFYLVALVSIRLPLYKVWKVLGIPLYFCTLNTAALVAFVELLRGHKYVIWDPVRKELKRITSEAPDAAPLLSGTFSEGANLAGNSVLESSSVN
jgi:cellulose synthase/poly-beta-1,6-N-acetylglucosamine synthase-like glycosyltransferase